MATRISSRTATATPARRLSSELFLSRSDPIVFPLGAMDGGLNTATATSARLLSGPLSPGSVIGCDRRGLKPVTSPSTTRIPSFSVRRSCGSAAGVDGRVQTRRCSPWSRSTRAVSMLLLSPPSPPRRLLLPPPRAAVAPSLALPPSGLDKYRRDLDYVVVCTVMVYGCAKQPGIVCRALRDLLEGGVGRGGGGGGVSGTGGEGDGHGEDDAGFGMGLFVQVAVLEIYNEEIYDLLVGSGSNAKGNTPKASIGIFGTGGYLGSYGGVGGYGNIPPVIQIRSLQKIAMILQVAF